MDFYVINRRAGLPLFGRGLSGFFDAFRFGRGHGRNGACQMQGVIRMQLFGERLELLQFKTGQAFLLNDIGAKRMHNFVVFDDFKVQVWPCGTTVDPT